MTGEVSIVLVASVLRPVRPCIKQKKLPADPKYSEVDVDTNIKNLGANPYLKFDRK